MRKIGIVRKYSFPAMARDTTGTWFSFSILKVQILSLQLLTIKKDNRIYTLNMVPVDLVLV